MPSPINPPNMPTNPLNQYASYAEATQAALSVSRTNPSMHYYLIHVAESEAYPDGTYKITTSPDESSAHAFVAGEMVSL